MVTFPDFWDYDYYYFNAVNEAHKQGKHLCVLKSRRKGYEQPYSEEVLTPTGFVTMGSLKVGDYVMNPNGQPVRIGDIVEQGVQEVYEVEF
nr:MAG: Hom-end-associated Hint [Bacteriophage sp.]